MPLRPIKITVSDVHSYNNDILDDLYGRAVESGFDVEKCCDRIAETITLKIEVPPIEVHRITKFLLCKENFNMPSKLFYSYKDADDYFNLQPAMLSQILVWEKLNSDTCVFEELNRK